jgi:hypothetical protein
LISPKDYVPFSITNMEPWGVGFYSYLWGHKTYWFLLTYVLLIQETQPLISIADTLRKVRSDICDMIVAWKISLQWRMGRWDCWLSWRLIIFRIYVNRAEHIKGYRYQTIFILKRDWIVLESVHVNNESVETHYHIPQHEYAQREHAF